MKAERPPDMSNLRLMTALQRVRALHESRVRNTHMSKVRMIRSGPLAETTQRSRILADVRAHVEDDGDHRVIDEPDTSSRHCMIRGCPDAIPPT
jgi:hypothetical protein